MNNYNTVSLKSLKNLKTSDGMQYKYITNGEFIKKDTNFEGLIESFITLFLRSIKYPYKFIEYSPCVISSRFNQKSLGCKSKVYRQGDEDISFLNLLENEKIDYNKILNSNKLSALEKFNKTTEFMDNKTKEELMSMLLIDCLVLNHDRHLNNIRFVLDYQLDTLNLFPAFDFGDSLLQRQYNEINISNKFLIKAIGKEKIKPFTTNPKTQLKMCKEFLGEDKFNEIIPYEISFNVNSLGEVYDFELINLVSRIFIMNLNRLLSDRKIIIGRK